MRLVLLGPPGAGKGTQARLLEAQLKAPQIASGDLLRTAVRNRTALGAEAKSYMDKGALVPDELVLKLIEEHLNQRGAQSGFILDGFPRTVAQAEALARMLETRKERLDKVIALIVPNEEIIKRISGRRTCRKWRTLPARRRRGGHGEDAPRSIRGVHQAVARPLWAPRPARAD